MSATRTEPITTRCQLPVATARPPVRRRRRDRFIALARRILAARNLDRLVRSGKTRRARRCRLAPSHPRSKLPQDVWQRCFERRQRRPHDLLQGHEHDVQSGRQLVFVETKQLPEQALGPVARHRVAHLAGRDHPEAPRRLGSIRAHRQQQEPRPPDPSAGSILNPDEVRSTPDTLGALQATRRGHRALPRAKFALRNSEPPERGHMPRPAVRRDRSLLVGAGSEAEAALAAPCVDDFSPALGGHARTKAVRSQT